MLDLRKIKPESANLDHERSRIRHIRVDDPEEKKRLWEIEKDKDVASYVEDLAEDEEELSDFCVCERDYLVLAVEGKEGHVDESEAGKLQGWLTFYNDEKRRLERLSKAGLANLLEDGIRVLELGFARHPRAKSGQMASALRQALGLLFDEHRKLGLKLVVTAYADETNQASKRVLVGAGFDFRGKIKYRVKNKTEDHFYVTGGVK